MPFISLRWASLPRVPPATSPRARSDDSRDRATAPAKDLHVDSRDGRARSGSSPLPPRCGGPPRRARPQHGPEPPRRSRDHAQSFRIDPRDSLPTLPHARVLGFCARERPPRRSRQTRLQPSTAALWISDALWYGSQGWLACTSSRSRARILRPRPPCTRATTPAASPCTRRLIRRRSRRTC